jgi:hypothetical protein
MEENGGEWRRMEENGRKWKKRKKRKRHEKNKKTKKQRISELLRCVVVVVGAVVDVSVSREFQESVWGPPSSPTFLHLPPPSSTFLPPSFHLPATFLPPSSYPTQ